MRLEATPRGNVVTIAGCRPPWHGESGEWTRSNIAQLRYNPTSSLDRVIDEIDEDPTCMFFG